MHANDLIIDNGSARKAVEGIAKLFPHLNREASTAFIIKSVDAVDTSTLVVSSQQKEVFRILDFVRKKQRNNLQRLLSAIYIIPQEKVIRLCQE